ncbi:MAG: thioredoxin [Cyanobium sp. PLM2.Bin73]|nr:MAG: thioredoxin [Cyanobium sp. PLM2.Bin73]
MHVFWSLSCPVCLRQKPWLEELEARFPGLDVEQMELSQTPRFQARFEAMAAERGVSASYVPTLMLGPRAWVGDTPAQRADIETAIAAALASQDPAPERADGLRLPLLGRVDAAAAPLLGLTVLIAFVDGFNPCSLWVLTLLLGLVVGSGSRRRVAVVGISFLLTTALIYGAFIAGLFSVLAFAFALPWVRWAVALFALGFGLVNIKDYVWYGQGISFSIPEGRKPGIYQRLRGLRQQELNTPLLIAATVAMAAGIALVELPCTAGFPVVWSAILAERQVGGAAFAGLLAVYVLIYLGIELVIFAVAITTLSLGRMGERQGRALKLLGGVVMVALAGALALRPELMDDLGGTLWLFGSALGLAALVLVAERLKTAG